MEILQARIKRGHLHDPQRMANSAEFILAPKVDSNTHGLPATEQQDLPSLGTHNTLNSPSRLFSIASPLCLPVPYRHRKLIVKVRNRDEASFQDLVLRGVSRIVRGVPRLRWRLAMLITNPHLTPPTRRARNPSPPPSRLGVWCGAVSYLSCLFVLFVIQTLFAAQPYEPVHPDPVLDSWRWRSFPELKGLGLGRMAEDKDGKMWFGVNDGVRVYDGVKWTAYTEKDGLLGKGVIALCATRDGSVYAGTDAGISRFHEGAWSRVFPLETDLPWNVWSLTETSDGSVWAATRWGALRLHQGGVTLYTTADYKAAIQALAPGVQFSLVPEEAVPVRPWNEGAGVGVFRGLITELAPGGPGERAGLKLGDRVLEMDGKPFSSQPLDGGDYTAASQAILAGPTGASVRLTVERKGLPEPFAVSLTRKVVDGAYPYFWLRDVYEDRDGAIWFGAYWGEIIRYDIVGAQPGDASAWQLYTEADGLECGIQTHILQTRDGTVWTVSQGGRGVNRFDSKEWTTLRLSDLFELPHWADWSCPVLVECLGLGLQARV